MKHLAAVLVFGAATLAWIWPIAGHPSVLVPGAGAGDNLTFVWNIWWIRYAIHHGLSPFGTTFLFAPFGVDLTLHTQTVLPSYLAATIGGTSVVLATNLMVAGNVWLTCAAAYALGYRFTRNVAAALLAGLVFGWSPFMGAHLQGHFNLIAGWILPLIALLAISTLEDRGRIAPILFGLCVACLPYIDYYYLVYGLALVASLVLCRVTSLRSTTPPSLAPRVARMIRVVLGLLLALGGAAALIAVTGGGTVTIAGHVLSMRSPDNLITACGWTAAALACTILGSRTKVEWNRARAMSDLRRLVIPAGIATLLTIPLALRAIALWTHGDYVSQRYLWKSAPAGVDAATLLLGNPYGFLASPATLSWYAGVHIDRIEQVAWIGPGVLGLCIAAMWLRRSDRAVWHWSWIFGAFLLWALGPYLMVFGRSTHVMLPETALRFIPIAANARIPGRAMSVAYLALALLAAVGFDALWKREHHGIALALLAAFLLDYAPAPVSAYRIDHPAVYDVLRTEPPGAVIELPLGLRDGFGETGRFDSRVLLYQTIHEHPIASGFVARLPPRVTAADQASAVIGSLLRLSGGGPIKAEPTIAPTEAARALRDLGFRFVVVDAATSPADLLRYVQATLPLERIWGGEGRTLYRIRD